MKKSLILVPLLGLPVMAGEPAPIPPAPAACPFSVEIGATYRFAAKELINDAPSKEIDVYGPEITGVYALTDEHALTLRFGYNNGSEALRVSEADNAWWKENMHVHSFYLMPGYRYTANLNETWRVFVGVSAGITNESLKYRYAYGDITDFLNINTHSSDWAIGCMVELGVQYHVTESTYLYAAYEFYASKAEPRFRHPDILDSSFGAKSQVYHSIRAGVGIAF